MSHLRYRFDHTRFVCLLKAPQNGRYDPYYSLSCLFPFRELHHPAVQLCLVFFLLPI